MISQGRFWTLGGCGNRHSTEMENARYATTSYDLQFIAGTFLFDGIAEKILRLSVIWDQQELFSQFISIHLGEATS